MASPSPREGGHGSYHPTRLALASSTAWSGTESSSEEPKYSYGGGAGAGGAAGRRAGLPGLAAGGSSSSGGDEEREVLQRPVRRYSEGRPRAGTLLPTAAQLAYSSAGAHSSLASTSADPRPYAPPVPPPRRSIEAVRSKRTSRRASILAEPRAGTSSRAANDGVEHEGGDRMLEGVHDRKGKAKERPVSRSYGSPITNDPLDLLSSLQIPSLPAIDSSRTSSPASSPNRSQLHEHRRSSVRIPADPSTFSFASSSSTPSNTAADPPPQTLQQLLANVDLSAALRLVQTVQNQQKAPPPPVPAPVPPPEPIYPTTPPPVNARLSRNVVRSASTSRSFSFGSSDVQRPLLADVRPSPASSQAGSQIKMDTKAIAAPGSGNARRRGLSLSFGGGLVPGRSRGLSELAMKREPTEEASKSTLRVPDERAVMGEEARIFEEQISRVHLTLSPATLRRSQNCAKYLSLRYAPVFDSLALNLPPPSPIAVSHWRRDKEEVERRWRRTRVGASIRGKALGSKEDVSAGNTGTPPSEGGSSNNGNGMASPAQKSAVVSPYGPRRNKHPGPWEIYPDDVVEYYAAGGKVDEAGLEAQERKVSGLGLGLRNVPRVTSESTASSIQGRQVSREGLGRHASREISPAVSLEQLSPRQFSEPPTYDGSPLARSGTKTSSSLRSTPSIASMASIQTTPITPKPPFATLTTIASLGQASPREELDEDVLHRLPAPPALVYQDPSSGSKSSVSAPSEGGLRSNLSRRLDKIRRRPVDADGSSDVSRSKGGGKMDLFEVSVGATPEVSEGEGPPVGRTTSRKSIFPRSEQGAFGRRRVESVKVVEGDASGDEGRFRRRLTKGARWARQGLRGASDAYPADEPRFDTGPERSTRRMILRMVESDDEEEYEVPREVLDLGDEEFAKVTTVLRQVRAQIGQVDTTFPRIPATLNHFLDEITQREKMTLLTLGIPVDYSFPRLSASVVSQLANSKELAIATVESPYLSDSSSSTSSSASSTDSDDEETPLPSAQDVPSSSRRSSVRFSQPRESNKMHSRRVTDPISRAVPMRARSQTIGAVAPGGLNRTPIRPSGERVDPLKSLQKVVDDLMRLEKEIEETAVGVLKHQERVGAEIGKAVLAVDEVQKSIDATNFQELRTVEEHFFRLRTSLTRPSSSVDLFWAILSYVLTALFWLSWLVVTLFRILRKIVGAPIKVAKWLLLLR